MRFLFIMVVVIAFVGCGPKSNEDKARDLITEKLKTTLPDFNSYEALNYGQLGTAFLPYEETDTYKSNAKELAEYRDSVVVLDSMINQGKPVAGVSDVKEKIKILGDSISAKSERNATTKQSYVPEKLFKMSHAYNVKAKDGSPKKTEDEFYFDEAMTKVVKSKNVY